MRPDLPCNEPRIYADAYGVDHVFVNGVQIIRDGKHTNARPVRHCAPVRTHSKMMTTMGVAAG